MFCTLYILPAAFVLFNESHIIARLSLFAITDIFADEYEHDGALLLKSIFVSFLQETKITNISTESVIRV
mgnify:CR=1 FL=1